MRKRGYYFWAKQRGFHRLKNNVMKRIQIFFKKNHYSFLKKQKVLLRHCYNTNNDGVYTLDLHNLLLKEL